MARGFFLYVTSHYTISFAVPPVDRGLRSARSVGLSCQRQSKARLNALSRCSRPCLFLLSLICQVADGWTKTSGVLLQRATRACVALARCESTTVKPSCRSCLVQDVIMHVRGFSFASGLLLRRPSSSPSRNFVTQA